MAAPADRPRWAVADRAQLLSSRYRTGEITNPATLESARDSAQITIVEGACNGITHAAQLQGTATFTFTHSTQLGSAQYIVNDGATMTFTADSAGPGQNGIGCSLSRRPIAARQSAVIKQALK